MTAYLSTFCFACKCCRTRKGITSTLLQTVAQEWAVEAMPTFMFVKGGKIVDKVVGAQKDQLQMTLAKHMATASA